MWDKCHRGIWLSAKMSKTAIGNHRLQALGRSMRYVCVYVKGHRCRRLWLTTVVEKWKLLIFVQPSRWRNDDKPSRIAAMSRKSWEMHEWLTDWLTDCLFLRHLCSMCHQERVRWRRQLLILPPISLHAQWWLARHQPNSDNHQAWLNQGKHHHQSDSSYIFNK